MQFGMFKAVFGPPGTDMEHQALVAIDMGESVTISTAGDCCSLHIHFYSEFCKAHHLKNNKLHKLPDSTSFHLCLQAFTMPVSSLEVQLLIFMCNCSSPAGDEYHAAACSGNHI